jgi:putative membrane protein
MSKKFLVSAISILFVLWMMPLHAQTPPANQTPPTENKPGQHEMKSMQGKTVGEAEIIAFLTAVDEHEIAAANEASQKKSDPKVGDFAQMMERDHSKHLEETRKLSDSLNIQPVDTPTIEKMKTEGKAELATLSKLQSANFDHAYMSAMVKGHTDALNHIDNHYMKMATNAELQSHLTTTRETVANHLAEAKKILGTLKPSSK